LQIFKGERFLLVYDDDTTTDTQQSTTLRSKLYKYITSSLFLPSTTSTALHSSSHELEQIQTNCHIVLHTAATSLDIVKSTLMLSVLRREIVKKKTSREQSIERNDVLMLIKRAKDEGEERYGSFLDACIQAGWDTNKFILGRVTFRNEWEIDYGLKS
jgi:hypothetical protein